MREIWLATVLATLSFACGSGDEDNGPTSDSGAGASGGTGGEGGYADGGADASDASGPPTCESLGSPTVHLGSAANSVTETWSVQAVGAPSTDPFHVAWEYTPRGYEDFRGTTAGDPLNLAVGDYPIDFGIIFPPHDSALKGRALCVGETVFRKTESGSFLTTDHAELLPQCPAPGGGENLTICSTCTDKVVGTLEGKTLDASGIYAFSGSEEPPDAYVQFQADKFVLRGFTNQVPAGSSSGDLEYAILFTYPESAFGAAAFCVTGPSTYSEPVSGGFSLELTGVVKLGQCSPGGGGEKLLACR